MIHLDTSFLIGALVAGSAEDGRIREWLKAAQPLGMSAIAWAEFLCGPLTDRQIDLAARLVPERAPFLDQDAELAARLFNGSGRRRGSFTDCMIAAAALRARADLATHNTSDFRRFSDFGLRLA